MWCEWMTLFILAQVMARRGFTHKQSKSDPNLARIWEIIDGRSVPVLQVNIVDGSFLEMPHYSSLTDKNKRTLADAKTEYKRRFQAWYKKSR